MTVVGNCYIQVSGRRQRGFTLIELMIAAAILVVVAVLALPSYKQFIERSQVITDQQTITESLKFASQLARTRGEIITMAIQGDGADWAAGYKIWVDSNNNKKEDKNERIEKIVDNLKGSVKGAASGGTSVDSIRFTARGLVMGNDSIQFNVCPKTTASVTKRKVITLLPSGAVAVAEGGSCS